MTTRQAILPCDHPDHLSDHDYPPALPFKPAYCPGGDLHFATAGTTSKGHEGATVIELTDTTAITNDGQVMRFFVSEMTEVPDE